MKPQLTPKEAQAAIEFLLRKKNLIKPTESITHANVLMKLAAIRDGRELPDTNVHELEGSKAEK